MINQIFNLNTIEISSPGNFIFSIQKFFKGFEHNDIKTGEINTLDGIEKYNNEQTCFFLSNHCSPNNNKLLYKLGKKLNKCIFICFHFNFEKDLRFNMPFSKYIITGEYYQKPPQLSDHIDAYNFSINCKNWLPFVFASSLEPNLVGKLKRQDLYDSVFVGAPYKEDWLNQLKNGFFHTGYSNFISEEDRINAFLSSRVCLGFHSDVNISNNCMTERVLEGLSYGCAVVSDNPVATEFTNGIVEYVSCFEEAVDFIDKCKEDEFFYDKQRKGYEFSKRFGLYYHQANVFLKKIKELYG